MQLVFVKVADLRSSVIVDKQDLVVANVVIVANVVVVDVFQK